MNDGTGKGIFQEWARRYAPGLIETQTAFPLDSDLGIPPKLAPIEGVFTGEKRNLSLGGPPPERMGYRGPGITPQTSSPATQETTSVPVAPTQENPLADYTPQPPVETATAEGEKKPGGISPVGMGILGMGLSMMATPPRQVPYSNAEIVGRSGLAGLGIYEKALEDKRRQQALDAETENRILTRQDQKLWREGLLADKETQREIAKQNAESLEKLRIASGEAKTGRLVPVKQSDGSIAYERMLDAVGQEVPQKPERLVPVEQADGSVTYEKTSEAVGQAVPQKAEQKYKNVPGVGMVNISGEKPFIAIPAPVFGKGGGSAGGGKPTANIQNIEYLVGNGWDRKEAEDVVLHGKRIPRENFIAKMVQSTFNNEFIDDKPGNVDIAIKFYDKVLTPGGSGAKSPAPAGKALDATTAQSYLQKAGGDKDKAREMARKDGYTF